LFTPAVQLVRSCYSASFTKLDDLCFCDVNGEIVGIGIVGHDVDGSLHDCEASGSEGQVVGVAGQKKGVLLLLLLLTMCTHQWGEGEH